MAKRKMDNTSFQDRWKADYLFTNTKDRAVCLACGANVAVTNDYNIRRHYETKYYEKYKDLDVKQKLQKVQKIKRSLVSQQTMFMKEKSRSEAALKASFIVAAEIEKSSRPFYEGEFVKKCMVKVCDIVSPDKKQDFLNVSLSRNTVVENVCELSTNLHFLFLFYLPYINN